MKITKDEAIILSACIDAAWDMMFNKEFDRELRKKKIRYLQRLSEKLDKAGKDQRRQGNTSRNDFDDILKRAMEKEKQHK
jgi:hypothetical protein